MRPMQIVFFVGFVLHILLLGSVFEIYFKTPIVPGIPSIENPVPGPAKRLVFIVADGLRADSFYRNDKRSTQFLRAKIETQASWGVSHTRVPTESRPGVVALAAGIYEDPSAVFKGWKANPAAFDTLFNQSRYTWAWGSPDIVHIFAQDHVETVAYSQEMQDFSGKNATWELDEWVINRLKLFFRRAKLDKKIKKLVRQDKLVFFLHLLGLDTAGHTIKPHSMNYQKNLQVVDKGIQIVEELFESFFEDGSTTYVFTADHGMTDWGSHGAGSQDETEVPLLAWGAGIRGPGTSDAWDPKSPKIWQLSHLKRKDVQQADIVVLLASLIGCNIPVNSVGRLPRTYLDMPTESLARLSLYNARQLLMQADRKREIIQSQSFSFLFYPFSKLTLEDGQIKSKLIDQFILSQKFDAAIQLCEELIDLSLQALHYYYTYYQIPLLTCTSFSFVGWIIWLVCQLNKKSALPVHRSRKKTDCFFVALAIIVFILVTAQGMEVQLIIYSLLPVFLWWSVCSMREFWLDILFSSEKFMKFLGTTALLITFTEIMVASFFQRWVLSVGVLLSALWPLFGTDKFGKDKISLIPPSMIFKWLLSCAFLALFPLLPVIGSESNSVLVTFSGLLWIAVLAVSICAVNEETAWTKVVHEMIPLAASIFINYYVTWSLDLGNGLPVFCQFVAWNLLFSSIIASMFGELHIPKRITKLYTTLLTPYMLLCVRHEGFFILALSFHLNCWLILEAKLNGISIPQLQKIEFPPPHFSDTSSGIRGPEPHHRNLTFEDFRRAALYVFYMFLAFFGTGNIASLNSFELIWVRCFVSVFSPFTMMFLIVIKMLIPFILVTSTFRAVNVTIRAPTYFMFIAVLIICDMMGLQFLFFVTNEGSWLDIGTSISHYCIVQFMILAVMLLYAVSSVLTGVSLMHVHAELAGILRGEAVRRQMTIHFRM